MGREKGICIVARLVTVYDTHWSTGSIHVLLGGSSIVEVQHEHESSTHEGFHFFPKTRCRRKACSTRMRDFEPDPMILDVRPGYSLSHSHGSGKPPVEKHALPEAYVPLPSMMISGRVPFLNVL